MRVGVALLALVMPISALGQFVVERPDLKVGDSWSYASTTVRPNRPKEQRTWTREIVARADDEYRTRIVIDKDGSSSTSLSGLTLDLNRIRSVSGQLSASGWFSFPLTQGKSWSAKEPWSDGGGYLSMTYTVVGMEKVSVPAGTFDSVKVVGKGRWVNTKANLQDVNEDTFWYAPAVRGIVRFIQTRWERGGVGLEVTEELVKYNLSGESVAK